MTNDKRPDSKPVEPIRIDVRRFLDAEVWNTDRQHWLKLREIAQVMKADGVHE